MYPPGPAPSTSKSYARIQYFRFDEYPDRWRELWDVFSREAVWSGAYDQYAASKRVSPRHVGSGRELLREIEGWRDSLARHIALRNKGLSSDDLNAAVQSTIDRAVFLRMAEDRGLEPYEQLLKLCDRDDIYPRFISATYAAGPTRSTTPASSISRRRATYRKTPTGSRRGWRSTTRCSSRSCKASTSPTGRPITSASCPLKSWEPSMSGSWAR